MNNQSKTISKQQVSQKACSSAVNASILWIWQPYLLFIINDHLCITCLADIFCLPLYQWLWTLYTHVYNSHKVLSLQPTISYICKWHFFFHIYDPLSMPCLAVTFVFCKYLRSHYCNLIIFHMDIVHTCVYIQITNLHEVFSWQPQIFTLVNHIFLSHLRSLRYSCLAAIFVLNVR